MYVHISQIEDFKVFDRWFKVDIKPLKTSLLNIIKQWSWMLKEHLLAHVIDR